MAALQARALAKAGWDVLQPDLTGCGDSAGEFSDARWEFWLGDISSCRQWLRENSSGPIWIWGLRVGALLACANLSMEPESNSGLLLWQPVTSGSIHLQQFLRIKVTGELVASGRNTLSNKSLMDDLQSGKSLEIAGYELSANLALPMAAAVLSLPACVSRVLWFEVSSRIDADLGPGSLRIIDSWSERVEINSAIVVGPSFWMTQEIEEAPLLLAATTRAFEE
jgi:uncharacterized protein